MSAALSSYFAGERVRDTRGTPRDATVMRVINRSKTGPCVQVLFDTGRNGAGALHCTESTNLERLPRLTLASFAEQFAPLPRRSSSKRGTSHLVQLPTDGGEEWSRGLRIPSYTLSTLAPTEPPPTPSIGNYTRVPVFPTLFVPGFPKSATTWLYTCISEAFTPRRAGCGPDANLWNASSCSRRFLLTPLTATRWQRGEFILESKKETFYFGGARHKFYRPDLLTLTGPDAANGALAGEPPLWAWEHKGHRVSRALPSVPPVPPPASTDTRAVSTKRARARLHEFQQRQRDALRDTQQKHLFERLSRMCLGNEAPCDGDDARLRQFKSEAKRLQKLARKGTAAAAKAPPPVMPPTPREQCTHLACHRVERDLPQTSNVACSWDESVHTRLGRNDSFCLSSLVPRAYPGEYKLVVGDFTPNYLCDAEALPRLRASAPDPDALRFVVVMREPAARARSEWAMFALQWAWDPIGDFATSLATRVQLVRECNPALFRNVTALRELPTAQLGAYLRDCWNFGGALMYVTNSMYSVCVLHALRYFRREQFLFLRYEDLMGMDHASLLRLLGRFSGLYAGDDLLKANEPGGRCQPRSRRGGRAVRTYDTLSPEEKVQYNESVRYEKADRAALDTLFAPYNELLSELVGHKDFTW